MATPAQILANRANSERSTGPKTETGKERSSRNSFRHGLTSSKIVLPGEDPAEYDAFRADILEQYKPANATEQILAEELAAAGWRLNRSRAVETEILKKLMGDAADSAVGLATVFVEEPKEFNRLLRYLTSIERAYFRVLDKLTKLSINSPSFRRNAVQRNRHRLSNEPGSPAWPNRNSKTLKQKSLRTDWLRFANLWMCHRRWGNL